jgi:hypothetical protein
MAPIADDNYFELCRTQNSKICSFIIKTGFIFIDTVLHNCISVGPRESRPYRVMITVSVCACLLLNELVPMAEWSESRT